jgi:outer membrane immunogenic protein
MLPPKWICKSAPAEEANVKKILLVVAALCVASSASAGDLPQRYNYNKPQVYQNLFNWSGFYAGVHGGLGWGDSTLGSTSGHALGAQIGYNYQLVSGMVFGVETDISLTGIDNAAFSNDYIGTVRGRIGYAFDRILLYATGGFAYAGGEFGGVVDRTHYGYALGVGMEGMITPNVSVRLEYLYTDFSTRSYLPLTGGIGFDTSVLRAGVNYRF